jgi:hypothetical protein
MIKDFYTTEFEVWRSQVKTDANGKFTERAKVLTTKGHLQQADAVVAQQLGLNFRTTFTLWCDVATNIKNSDEIRIGSNKYTVSGIQRNDIGDNQHLEVIINL